MQSLRTGWFLLALAAAIAALTPACAARPRKRPRAPDTVVIRDTPAVLRDTVLAQASMQGIEPILVSGYGLVVGLNNTGGGDAPGPVRAAMEREMLIMGVGKEIGPFRGLSPDDILNDKRTAVVIVSAAIPPGAPKGLNFDVRVDALPGSATTSLEGGRLYTTRLFRGLVRPSMPATQPIALAKGEVFINPFADPAKQGAESVYRTAGRVLGGGVLTNPSAVLLTTDAPSHDRVVAIADAINSRFPRGRGEEAAARGRNEETVEINVPASYRENAGDFFNLVRHLRVDRLFPEEAAKRYIAALREQPEISESLAWCLEALGPVAIPHARTMYDYPEVRPRMAAITAGARLGDLASRVPLQEIVLTGPPGLRVGAITLLAGLPTDPKVNEFIRDLLNSPDLEVRIAAYEGLVRRRDPWIERRRAGDKFILDLVPSAEPMVFATLQKEPRIAVFGDGLKVRRPVFATAWDNRLLVSAQSESAPLRVFYRDYRGPQLIQGEIPPGMAEFIQYLAHQTTPEEPAPGLNLTYSEVVGALATMLSQGLAAAPFVPQTDALELQMIRLRESEHGQERPEFDHDELKKAEAKPPEPPQAGAVAAAGSDDADAPPAAPPAKRSYVVPLSPKTTGRPAGKGDGSKGY